MPTRARGPFVPGSELKSTRAREHVQAMGEPDGDSLEPRRRRAQERARREREQRLAQALSEYENISAVKRPG